MKHSPSLLIIALALITATRIAAQSSPNREIGLRFSNFNLTETSSFSAVYKKQLSENKFRRYRFGFGNIGLSNNGNDVVSYTSGHIGGGIAIGTERRKSVGSKTYFLHGWEWNAGTQLDNEFHNGGNYYYYVSLGLGYVLGIQHEFNKYLAMNLEIIPGAHVAYSRRSDGNYNFNTGASFSSTAALSVMYRFGG